MSDAGTQRTASASHRPGRHRRSAGADTWTPAVDPIGGAGRHRAGDAQTEPVMVSVISGELPLALVNPAAKPAARPARPAARPAVVLAAKPTNPAKPATPAGPELAGRPVVERTKVTLGPPAERAEPAYEEALVYLASPLEGLGSFDLGSVPASVTPPRSWRKAAWFATVSSAGVAVAMMLAGSYLVGQPPQGTNDASGSWPGLQGRPPIVHDEGVADESPESATRTTRTTDGPQTIADAAGRSSNAIGDGSSAPTTSGFPGSSTSPGGPTTDPEPDKPPVSAAPRQTRKDAVYNFPPDAETMGDRSETFLNEITENPERAHEQTGGDLYAQGADGIAARYEHIAYFEVRHIYIDQENRVTVNEVHIVYTDGTEETAQRTLRFEEGDKITDDGA